MPAVARIAPGMSKLAGRARRCSPGRRALLSWEEPVGAGEDQRADRQVDEQHPPPARALRLLETGAVPAHRYFETRSYAASVCLLTAENDSRPPGRIHSVATPYPNLARQLLSGMAPEAEINSLAVRRCFTNVTTHLVRSERCNPAMVAPVVGLLARAQEAVR